MLWAEPQSPGCGYSAIYLSEQLIHMAAKSDVPRQLRHAGFSGKYPEAIYGSRKYRTLFILCLAIARLLQEAGNNRSMMTGPPLVDVFTSTYQPL